eukprot:TRINITY_DN1617_c0_g1_i1.p1 TRINITY_DN1617_c0_g1~~TRINITY_DN1617_c0_g1_i1.p1  ORF type:complete len:268 (-),score=37.83 TRINITY_DN1617_c0_g1_i1:148-951(-)
MAMVTRRAVVFLVLIGLNFLLLASTIKGDAAGCPTQCRSFVQLSTLSGTKEIGPDSTIQWQVVQMNDGKCVDAVDVSLIGAAQPVSFQLNNTFPQMTAEFRGTDFMGSGVFSLDTGCPNAYFQSGVPQLRIDYVATNSQVSGGFNGSIVFDSNFPESNQTLIIGTDVTFSWTACITSGPLVSILQNATIWTTIEDFVVGAVYLDEIAYSQQSVFYAIGDVNRQLNVTATFEFSSEGVTQKSLICEFGECTTNQFMIFGSALCDPNSA